MEHLAILIANRHDSLKLLVAPLDCSEKDSLNLSTSQVTCHAEDAQPKGDGTSTPSGKIGSKTRSKKVEEQSPSSSAHFMATVSPPSSKKKGRGKPTPPKADPWDFPCVEEEARRGPAKKPPSRAARKVTSGGDRGTAALGDDSTMADVELGDELGRGTGDAGPDPPTSSEGPPGGSVWDRVASSGRATADLLCELRLALTVLENATFTCAENEDEVIRMQVRGSAA